MDVQKVEDLAVIILALLIQYLGEDSRILRPLQCRLMQRRPTLLAAAHLGQISRTRRNLLTSASPKLKSNPRDRPSSRRGMDRAEERNPRYGKKCNDISLFGGGDSDWSDALNFNSIWNCGGTDTGTMSPSNNNGKSVHRPEPPRA